MTLLGTGSPLPSPDRAGPATLVRVGEANLLVDCGRGVVMRLAAAGLVPAGLSAVLLTHLHSDHITDLNDIVTSYWLMAPAGNALPVIGPPGTGRVIRGVLEMLAPDQDYRIRHHADLNEPPALEVREVEPGDEFAVGGATIKVCATDHRPVTPTVGYRVEGGGSSAALAGDTVPCPGLDELCQGVDIYVQSVIRADLVMAVPNRRLQDILDYHSTVQQAAETASRADVGTLVMTHCVPPVAPGAEEEWRALAAAHFGGRLVVGSDLTTVRAGD